MTAGMVYLVGAGPGDPGLLTLRGGELLVTCDAVVYDTLANPALLALAAMRGRAGSNSSDSSDSTERDLGEKEFYDVGKRGGAAQSARQDEINALLIRLAHEGKRVVRLKGGDPFVFGRGGEEAQALAGAGVTFEVVPGVTAGVAAAAYAGIPVTHRGIATSVTFVTGHEDPAKESTTTDWHALARTGGTLVLYMGVKTLPRTIRQLLDGGKPADTPAAAVEWGTYPRQRTVTATLSTIGASIRDAGLAAPVITIIGDVVGLRNEIAWFDRKPLFGKCIVVTRAQFQAASLSERLIAAGAEVIEMPATRIEPLDARPLRAALPRLGEFGWLIFTSQNAVQIFWDVLRSEALDARALAGVKIAAVGPATSDALLDHGLSVDVSPERFVAEGLLDAMRERRDVRGVRMLYVSAEGARETLRTGLDELGAVVEHLAVYRSVPDGAGADALRDRLADGSADLVTFTSASAVRAFVAAVGGDAAGRVPAASIGPITSEEARNAGLDVVIEATDSTIPGLVDAITRHYAVAELDRAGTA